MNSPALDSRARQHLFILLCAAFALRVIALVYLRTHTAPFDGSDWGFEAGMVSRSLAEGKGFSSPFGGDTGPTAWVPPAGPVMQALIFKLFGIQSAASAIAVRVLNIVFDVGACFVIFRLAGLLWGRTFGFLAGWAWALCPDAIWFDNTTVSYGSLSVLLLCSAMWLALRFDSSRTRDWILQGILWGAIALSNPTLLALLPICCLFPLLKHPRLWIHWRGILLSSFVFLLCVFPWSYRNYRVFGRFILVRSNFGHELYKGNHYGADGGNDYALNAWNNPAQISEYVRLGEIGYVREHKRIAQQFIRENPSGFFRLFRRRVSLFWDMPNLPGIFGVSPAFQQMAFLALVLAGLSGILIALFLDRRTRVARDVSLMEGQSWPKRLADLVCPRGAIWLFAAVVLVYPIPYYVTFPNDRYRLPIEPILMIFALHLLFAFRHMKDAQDGKVPLSQAGLE